MLGFEAVAVAYFVGFAAASLFARAPPSRRVMVAVAALVGAGVVMLAAGRAHMALRFWLAHGYLVAGYWLPPLLVPARRTTDPTFPTTFGRWLLRTDPPLRKRLPAVPPAAVHLVELAYLFCYPLVPVSFLVVWMLGTPADANRFWLAVLPAGFACYATLPWLVSRPPRLAEVSRSAARGLRAMNVFVLGRVSHQLNTFPSGHVAVSCACSVAVWWVSPLAGTLAGAVAAAVAIGAVAGRYHYVIDVILAAIVAAVSVSVV